MRRLTGFSVAFLALVLAGCHTEGSSVGSVAPPDTDATVIRISFNQPEHNPQYIALEQMGERLKERTNGAYEVLIYPNELLGAQRESMELVQTGAIDMAVIVGSLMENFVDEFAVFNLPYVFHSKEHQMSVINDEQIVSDLYQSLEDDGISVLGAFHGGVRNVYNTRHPIETPADLSGLKIRIIESDTNIQMMRQMGGTGTPMGQGEVYTAIQSGVLDGGENNELIYSSLNHVEIAPYYSYTQHLMVPDYIISSTQLLNGMTEEHKEIFMEEIQFAVDEQVALFDEEVEQSIAAATEAGATFNDVDMEAFQQAVQPVIDSRLQSQEARALYERVQNEANQ
ncbi:TRAP transporter substrate-binding protein [Bacillus sp. JCM 19041]|uniref:TRAP transporter substrate-binding protein n=1 Tax=Bacillus sp. JCM 19041 TaxID=1460637 RepID=UPI0006CF6385